MQVERCLSGQRTTNVLCNFFFSGDTSAKWLCWQLGLTPVKSSHCRSKCPLVSEKLYIGSGFGCVNTTFNRVITAILPLGGGFMNENRVVNLVVTYSVFVNPLLYYVNESCLFSKWENMINTLARCVYRGYCNSLHSVRYPLVSTPNSWVNPSETPCY